MNEASAVAAKVCSACGSRYPGDALFCPADGMPLTSAGAATRAVEDDPYLGQEISGHIEIRQLVGIGAMGRVYRAFQRGIDRDVAVKILHRELSANPQLVARFTREAKVASRLQHPNVVQVFLAGQLADRALYMVMEYLDGLSLHSALAAAGGALPLSRALHVVLQLCEATGEAHAQGVVHRDLKPENVMLVRRGADEDFVKILDFGIARINWGEQSIATAAGLIFGTARYISPEGAQGNAVGPASDVYAIATLLYHMLSGRTPFEGDQAVGLLVQQIHDTPPPLLGIPQAAHVPPSIAEVIMANLAKDPAARAPDAREFGRAIIDAAKRAGLSSEDISRPLLSRPSSPSHQPPTERTKPAGGSNHSYGELRPADRQATAGDRPISAATAKWEPSPEFRARIASSSGAEERTSGVVPSSPGSSPDVRETPTEPRASSVDETLDEGAAEAAPGRTVAPSSPSFPAPSRAVPRTVPGEVIETRPAITEYAQPAPEATRPPPAATPLPVAPAAPPPQPARSSRPTRPTLRSEEPSSGSGRRIAFVFLCFVLGAALATLWAYRTGRLGGEPDDERFVVKATEAMYKNRFVSPPGENVRDITDEGLKRWPGHHRLLDIRMRAANELTSQALTQRSAGDIAEALRLARAAHELDPHDASSKRLIDQYEAELAALTVPAAPPLDKPQVPATSAKPTANKPTPGGEKGDKTDKTYRVQLDVSVETPRVGQTIELVARAVPPGAAFESPSFLVAGGSLGQGVQMPAHVAGPGIFRASYVLLEVGKFEVTFSTTADKKPLRATRSLVAGEAPRAPTPVPAPSSTASVKWM